MRAITTRFLRRMSNSRHRSPASNTHSPARARERPCSARPGLQRGRFAQRGWAGRIRDRLS
ncbi:hypothetical protein HMPREF9154_2038 [Arachnia propionica F0230a]|nr:hypothetical protein HMPREF9154_2038 [Arachnia propionica F0230a]